MKNVIRFNIGLTLALCAWAQQGTWAENEAIVKFSSGTALSSATAALRITHSQPVGGTGAVLVHSKSLSTPALVAALRKRKDVAYAEPNYRLKAFATPNDTGYAQQWAMPRIKAPLAWDVSTGSTRFAVGVMDSGIDYTHPDLADNVWSAPSSYRVDIGGRPIWCPARSHGFNAITNACDPIDDSTGHGTHVAGIIGAKGHNGQGVTGINWTTQIIAVKFLNSSGEGLLNNAINALQFLLQTKKRFPDTADIRVINNSWGCTSTACNSEALKHEVQLAREAGILFVAAAGDGGFNNDFYPLYPASYVLGNVLSVAATNQSDSLNDPTNSSNYGESVQLAAPGTQIYSTFPPSVAGTPYWTQSGSSLAAALVAGSAALILSACPDLNVDALKAAILRNTETVPGRAGQTEKRLLDVNKAIRSCFSTSADTNVVNSNFISGPVVYQAATSITGIGVTISSDANVSFSAGAYIRLLPEFRATAGSAPVTFRARIQ